ncbi:MFS transporter [Streptomyces sp. NBC_01433]|uniref:MFS transporter n=1 Tax=Streptomyces sp. NBC_01433 TaxID=2903864 RepID=UPI00224D9BBC|nr:MFS transporter [Streptomyces sp. NBC_01433]MCX4679078.1 MFS transporter [Streptomyces sp. NBC_01433]
MFRHPAFRLLFLGQVLTSFAGNALFLSLGVWAKDLTGSNTAAGLVFFFVTLPVVCGPFIGHLVDRFHRRSVLMVACGGTAALVMLLLLVHSADRMWLVHVVAAGYGVAAIFVRASQAGLIKSLIPPRDLAAANAYLRSAGDALRVVSPLVGVGVYAVTGGPVLAVLVAGLYLLALVIFRLLPRTRDTAEGAGKEELSLRRLSAGLQHLWSHTSLAVMTAAIAAAYCVLGFFDSTDFAVVQESLHRPPSFFSVLTSLQGAGSIGGGLTAALLVRRLGEHRTAGIGLAAMAFGALGMTQTGLVVVLGAFALFGVGATWLAIGYSTAWQRHTPGPLIGRVSTAADLSMLGPQAASILLGAVLIGFVPYRVLLLVCFVTLLAAGIALLSTHGRSSAQEPDAEAPPSPLDRPPDREPYHRTPRDKQTGHTT